MKITTLLSSLLLLTSPLWATTKPKHVQAELISETTSIQPNSSFWVGLKLTLDPEWHVYWTNPGETGFAPSIEWNLPEGFEASDLAFPTPKRFAFEQFVSYGYSDSVLLLAEISTPDNLTIGETITLKGTAEWLVCKDECKPGSIDLEITLPIASETAWSSHRGDFENTRARHPKQNKDWDVSAHFHNGTMGILVKGKDDQPIQGLYFFSEHDDAVAPTPTQAVKHSRAGTFLTLPLADEDNIPESLTGILIKDGGWGNGTQGLLIDEEIKVSPLIVESMQEVSYDVGLLMAMGFAFVGGLILNLMPCVFPILSLKILGFVQQAGEDVRKVKKHGIVFGIGVLVSFWVLVAILLSLRAGGESLGWGFQLQEPGFIVTLVFLLSLVALNFAGLFEFGTSLISTGSRFGLKSGYTGSFSSGVLATVLATPCTAPFMGTALGFALSQPPLYAIAIFTMLALGMAAPYVILSFNTNLLRFLPKPGPWMETFKQFMAFPMLATVLWLVWVFGQQAGSAALVVLLFGILILSMAAWVYGRFATFGASKLKKTLAIAATLALTFASIQLGTTAMRFGCVQEIGENEGLDWEEFSPERLQTLINDGDPVFIDFTAAWCLTCQANKANVFTSDEVIETLKNKKFTLLKADWTSRDKEILETLQAYGRSGVPTNVIYGKGPNAKAKILPELLTPGIVLEALNSI